MTKEKYDPDAIRLAFKFLVDEFDYIVERDEEVTHDGRPYAFILEFSGNDRKILLNHDYKDNFFYFMVVKGIDTQYPNEEDTENIISFYEIFRRFKPELNLDILQPHRKSCAEAAETNAHLLKSLASDILLGNNWI